MRHLASCQCPRLLSLLQIPADGIPGQAPRWLGRGVVNSRSDAAIPFIPPVAAASLRDQSIWSTHWGSRSMRPLGGTRWRRRRVSRIDQLIPPLPPSPAAVRVPRSSPDAVQGPRCDVLLFGRSRPPAPPRAASVCPCNRAAGARWATRLGIGRSRGARRGGGAPTRGLARCVDAPHGRSLLRAAHKSQSRRPRGRPAPPAGSRKPCKAAAAVPPARPRLQQPAQGCSNLLNSTAAPAAIRCPPCAGIHQSLPRQPCSALASPPRWRCAWWRLRRRSSRRQASTAPRCQTTGARTRRESPQLGLVGMGVWILSRQADACYRPSSRSAPRSLACRAGSAPRLNIPPLIPVFFFPQDQNNNNNNNNNNNDPWQALATAPTQVLRGGCRGAMHEPAWRRLPGAPVHCLCLPDSLHCLPSLSVPFQATLQQVYNTFLSRYSNAPLSGWEPSCNWTATAFGCQQNYGAAGGGCRQRIRPWAWASPPQDVR